MAPRSSRHHSRYDDPYTFDDPYIHSPPTAHNQPAYEYIGTDEPLSPRPGSPARRTYSPDRERSRRYRTTSPPRRSRRDDMAYAPPPHTSHHSSSPRPGKDITRERGRDPKKQPKGKHFYSDFADHNPKLQRYGKQGLNWLSEAAAAYAAAQAGKEAGKDAGERKSSRSVDRDDRDDRRDRSRRHHHRRHASIPSPSPSRSPSRSPSPPPRRRHSSAHHLKRDSDRDHDRRRRYSASPPPLSRNPDSYLASQRHSSSHRPSSDRSRDRDRGRARSHHPRRYSPSPSPSRRSRARGTTAPPANPAAERWQMAARAALEAGGLTAFRLRKQPGSWTGDKAAKVATAALGAAAMDAFMDQDPRGARGGMKGMAENAISSLIASQIMGKNTKRKGRGRF
ncbi:hypothetical protein F5Y01DRAFT_113844 [Xylaria sp. FL0043]|nr:hypothetical protein F5Y01DRAFT_113844 [Xylaria sp. FL0043]